MRVALYVALLILGSSVVCSQPQPPQAEFKLATEWTASLGPWAMSWAVPTFASPHVFVLQPHYGALHVAALHETSGQAVWNTTLSGPHDAAPGSQYGTIAVAEIARPGAEEEEVDATAHPRHNTSTVSPRPRRAPVVFVSTFLSGNASLKNATPPCLIALDATSGVVMWRVNGTADNYFSSSVDAAVSPDGSLVVVGLGRFLFLVDAQRGHVLDRTNFSGAQFQHAPLTYVVMNSYVVVKTGLPPIAFMPHTVVVAQIPIVGTGSQRRFGRTPTWAHHYDVSLTTALPHGPVWVPARSFGFGGAAPEEATGTAGNETDGSFFIACVSLDMINASTGAFTSRFTLFDTPSGVSYDAPTDRLVVGAFESLTGFRSSGSIAWYEDLMYNSSQLEGLDYLLNPMAVHHPTGVNFFTATYTSMTGIGNVLCGMWANTGQMLGCHNEGWSFASPDGQGYPPRMAWDYGAIYVRNTSHAVRFRIVRPF